MPCCTPTIEGADQDVPDTPGRSRPDEECSMTTERQDLIDRLLEHCAHVCGTGEEAPIADAVEHRYRERGEQVVRLRNSVVVGGPARRPGDDPSTAGRPLVLLVGHLDVVPPTDDDLRATFR